jgi:hypothetical protein
MTIHLSGGTSNVTFSSATTNPVWDSASPSEITLTQDETYTVTFIHEESGQIIAEIEVNV